MRLTFTGIVGGLLDSSLAGRGGCWVHVCVHSGDRKRTICGLSDGRNDCNKNCTYRFAAFELVVDRMLVRQRARLCAFRRHEEDEA